MLDGGVAAAILMLALWLCMLKRNFNETPVGTARDPPVARTTGWVFQQLKHTMRSVGAGVIVVRALTVPVCKLGFLCRAAAQSGHSGELAAGAIAGIVIAALVVAVAGAAGKCTSAG